MSDIELRHLKTPFRPDEIEWRIQQSGWSKQDKPWAQALAYVQARAIQDRLDDVCGPENWKNEYTRAPEGGILCGISIRFAGGEWVTKWDGAENTDIEAVKGGLSGAFKRAAVQWGIGRYLYQLETTFVEVTDTKGEHRIGIKKNKTDKQPSYWGYWNDPKLPVWALPREDITSGVETASSAPAPAVKATRTSSGQGMRTEAQWTEIVRLLWLRGYNTPEAIKAKLSDMGYTPPLTVAAAGQVIDELKTSKGATNV